MTSTTRGEQRDSVTSGFGLHQVIVELLCLSIHDGEVPPSSRRPLDGGTHPDHAAREQALAPGGLVDPDAVVHSTSWRAGPDGLVLTYALFPGPPDPDRDMALNRHVVTGPDARHPSPVTLGPGHVAAHAARHLDDLARRDPHVRQAADRAAAAWDALARHAARTQVVVAFAPELVEREGPPDLVALHELSRGCAVVDGHAPFDEHTLLSLDGPRQLTHSRFEVRDGDRILGCAVLTAGARTWTVELGVLPAVRGRRWGSALLDAARSHVASHGGGVVTTWTHGDAPAAAALGRRWGAQVTRRLDVLRRPLLELPAPDCALPPDLALRHLDPAVGADRDAWLALTNAAFQGHPDNGGWTRRDLDWRASAAWTDGTRWPVLTDGRRLHAGVWTKREPGSSTGELYVVAVAPHAQGRGLGRLVVTQALHDLAAEGCTDVEL